MEWWQLSLSLPLGFNFLLSCLKAITVASCQNRHGTRCAHVLVFLTVATSQYLKWCAISPLASPPSFHTTSGAVGLPPSSGGGLRCCILQHISEKDPPQDEDRLRWQVCVWAARHVCHALTSVYNSAGCKFQFLQEVGCFFVLLCVGRNGWTRAWRR